MEIAALTLILGVLCYAFYDSNIKGSEQEIVLTNELFTMSEIKNKEDITMEMLSIPGACKIFIETLHLVIFIDYEFYLFLI